MRNEDRLKLIAARQKLIDDAKAVVPTQEPTVQEPTVQEPVPEVVEEPTPIPPPEIAEDDLSDEDVVIEDEWPSIESEPPTDD